MTPDHPYNETGGANAQYAGDGHHTFDIRVPDTAPAGSYSLNYSRHVTVPNAPNPPNGDGGAQGFTVPALVTPTPTPTPVPRQWSSGSQTSGTKVGENRDSGGSVSVNGRLLQPQNQTVDPATPATVRVAVGQSLDMAVAAATDWDKWTKDLDGNGQIDPDPAHGETGYAQDAVSYTWSGGGTFTGGGKTRETQWKAIAPGVYDLTCTIDDAWRSTAAAGQPRTGVEAPEGGDRNDELPDQQPPLVRHVTVTVEQEVTLTVAADRTSLCAGGWNDTYHDYAYLQKETGRVVRRGAKPDPHVGTVTVVVKDADGNVLLDAEVTFSWDMPGPAPAETRTVTTDADGRASVDIVSGDEVSTDTDEETEKVLFNDPVQVQVECSGSTATQLLNVVAPQLEWQYKNEDGEYESWDGEIYGLYEDESRSDLPLRVALTFDGLPVKGHPVSWGIEKILNKAGDEVDPSDSEYATYGHMSGSTSTTTANGYATATFTRGSTYGEVVFQIEDAGTFTYDDEVGSPLQASASSSNYRMFLGRPAQERKPKKVKVQFRYDYWKYVKDRPQSNSDGSPSSATQNSYPAPAGEEDNELLPNTLTKVRSIMPGKEWTKGGRNYLQYVKVVLHFECAS